MNNQTKIDMQNEDQLDFENQEVPDMKIHDNNDFDDNLYSHYNNFMEQEPHFQNRAINELQNAFDSEGYYIQNDED